jgi:hypothetical protein
MQGQLYLLPELAPPPPVDRRAEVLAKVMDSATFKPDFIGWLQDNWSIWLRFEFEANKVRERGRQHYAARRIGEYIRHTTALRQKKNTFKVNDHVWPDLARLYVLVHPDAVGFFEFRGRQ